jgi:hypothetical protein
MGLENPAVKSRDLYEKTYDEFNTWAALHNHFISNNISLVNSKIMLHNLISCNFKLQVVK